MSNVENIFETATRIKVRFQYKGMCSVEDLWDLSMDELDKLYGKLRAEQKTSQEESLMNTTSRADALLNLKVELVRHVFGVKKDEKAAERAAADNKLRKQRLAAIIAEKREQGLKDMSIEDLEKQLAELD